MNTNEETINEARKSAVRHALLGAMYGFLMGTAFVVVAAFINVWLYPELPLGVEREQALTRWLLIGLGLILIGALTSVFTETFHGLVAGTVAAGVLTLTAALYLSSTSTGAKFLVLFFTLGPVAVMSLPVIWLIRRLSYQHALALSMKRSALRITLLILAAIASGAIVGYFMKMTRSALLSVQMVHENIQAAPENQDSKVSETPGFMEHRGMKYMLFQKPSTASTVGFDVRAEYEDGYTLECVVVVYPGTPPYLRSCKEIPKS